MNKVELLKKCKELGIKKCSSKNKTQLIELINRVFPICWLESFTSVLSEEISFT